MSAVPSWGGTINVQRNVVLQASGNPNSGSTEDLVQEFMTHKALESSPCSQLMQNTQKLYCSPYYQVFFKAYRRECDDGIPYRISVTPLVVSPELLEPRPRTINRMTIVVLVVHNLVVLDSNLGQVTSLL